MSPPAYFNGKGRQLAAGEMPMGSGGAGLDEGPNPRPSVDPRLDRPRRPCSWCGRRFAPMMKRRMLCSSCFGRADNSHGDW